jgi:hypothetical protein
MTIKRKDLERLSDRELSSRIRREAEKGEDRSLASLLYRDALEAELEARELLQRIDR